MARDEAYRKAEKKIEECRRKAAKQLNLGSMGLTTLPDSIANLTQLDLLIIYNNQLTELPESIGNLSQLRELNVAYNELTELPDSIGNLTQLQLLRMYNNQLTELPDSIGNLTQLQHLEIYNNQLSELPGSIGNLTQLQRLVLQGNRFKTVPDSIGDLRELTNLQINGNKISELPASFSRLKKLQFFYLSYLEGAGGNEIVGVPDVLRHLKNLRGLYLDSCQITDLPDWFIELDELTNLSLDENPLNPELAAAYYQGLDAVKKYLRAKAESSVVLNEAKLILIGEGDVGKTSLLSALRGDKWEENRKTTHGVEVDIKSLKLTDVDSNTEVTFNCWDFGGQNIYRHTHQMYFTAPAIYLAVWNPRRGPEVCKVDEWIKMVKHRAYDDARPDVRPRIFIIATHGGPQERSAHIDEQLLRDEFGDLIAGFHHVDSKTGYGLDELKAAIARAAVEIPSVGRRVPASWKNMLEALRKRSKRNPYINFKQFKRLCNSQDVPSELVNTYIAILNELGHLIYYQGDSKVEDTVILKPEWLSKAMSYVLEDSVAKEQNGLVAHDRLSGIWDNPKRPSRERYPADLHPIFLKLMEQFDLTYRVVMPGVDAPATSLVSQLVPGGRPDNWRASWSSEPVAGDSQRTQICRIIDAETGKHADVQGLIYRLIVRLHRYSLGRHNFFDSCHWKTGMILDDDFNGRAFIEEISGDIFVTVRAAYPERFLAHLSAEINWLVKHFWKGLDARLYVPCSGETCKGLLELREIVAYKKRGIPEIRCSVCEEFHPIDSAIKTPQPKPALIEMLAGLRDGQREILQAQKSDSERLSTQLRILMSQADEQYANLLAWLSDPAKEGPRLFSFEPVNRSKFDPRSWTKERFHLTLWCEHSQKPLPLLNSPEDRQGIIEIELTREWFKTAAPVIKFLTGTLSLILPVAAAGVKLAVDETILKDIEGQLDFGQEIIDASLSGAEKSVDWLEGGDEAELEREKMIRAQGSVLRKLHALLKAKDPGFGGLVRVQNKRREFLWVHPRFKDEY